MLKKILLFFLLVGSVTSMVSGQIATPSLDQSIAVKAGTATPWRYFDSVGAYYITKSGEEKKSDLKSSGFEGTLIGGNGVLFMGMFGFEADILSNLDYKYSGVDTTEGDLSIEISKQKYYLTYRFGEHFAIAAESFQKNLDSNFTNSVKEVIRDSSEAKTGLGASLRFAGPFFIASGLREVTSTGTKKINSVSYALKSNSWQETYYGLAVLTGAPGQHQFRAEYSMTSSPETKQSGALGANDNHHQKTESTLLATEVKFGNWLFRYKSESTTESDLSFDAVANEETTVTTAMGIAFIQEAGFTLGIYQITDEMTGKKNDADVELSSVGTSITLGFIF